MTYLAYSCVVLALIYWIELPGIVNSNWLIMRKDPANDLELWLKSFSWGPRQELGHQGKLPRYKFYTETVEILLTMARRMGGSYQDSLLFLREGLQVDRQFEKKIKEAVLGMWLQMGLMMALTWAFILGALQLVDVRVEGWNLFVIFLWQSIGMGALPFALSSLRKRFFGEIGKIWKMLFVLKSLQRVPLSRTEILTLAGVQELDAIKQKSLLPIVSKLKETCQKTLKLGVSYEEDVKHLMEELRFQEKWHFELFEKRLGAIKLALMAIFFLPSYLGFIFLLLGDLLTLM